MRIESIPAWLIQLPVVQRLTAFARELPVSVPIRLFDGRIRRGRLRLWFLVSLWQRLDSLRSESQQAYDAYSGGDVVDVGAFHGWYSLLLAPKSNPGDRFVSFEPDPEAQPALLRGLGDIASLFPDLRLSAIAAAAGDGRPAVVYTPTSPHPSFHSADEGSSGSPTLTIDGLVETLGLAPTLVKIDVEGAEWFVLSGMHRTLERLRPTVILEVHIEWQPQGVTIERISSLLIGFGYELKILNEGENSVVERQLWHARA